MTAIKNAISCLINQWKADGESSSNQEFIADAFLHLRWRMETMSLEDALKSMRQFCRGA